MTTTEPAPRKATAMEVARETAEQVAQLRTELTEIRTAIREGGPQDEAPESVATRLSNLDHEFGEFVEAVNKRFADGVPVQSVGAADTSAITDALAELETKTAQSFKAYSDIVDKHNAAAGSAIEELRQQMPSVATLVAVVTELTEKVRLFEEAGVAPASSEDLNLVHQRVNDLDRDMHKMRGYLESPTFAAVERAADRMEPGVTVVPAGVPAIYRQVHELMNLVTELGKDKVADKKMGGYAFRSIDGAMDAVGQALRKVGVMFQPREILDRRVERYETVSKDGFRQNWTHVWVTQRYAFVSLIDGSEMAAIEMDGEARDNGDKSTSKADSMRFKYALLQALCIPINGLPESDGRDGTEGDFAPAVGRGSAGDAFDNASPARPNLDRIEQQHVDTRPPATPEEVENSDRSAAPVEADDRTPEEKATAAYNALVALAGIERPAQRPKLNAIMQKVSSEGIGHVVIMKADGQQVALRDYVAVVNSQVGV